MNRVAKELDEAGVILIEFDNGDMIEIYGEGLYTVYLGGATNCIRQGGEPTLFTLLEALEFLARKKRE